MKPSPALPLLLLCATLADAREPGRAPATELARFAPLLGTWEGGGRAVDAPGSKPYEWTARSTYRWVLDGHFMLEETRFDLGGDDGPLATQSFYGWDHENQRYLMLETTNFGTVRTVEVHWTDDEAMVHATTAVVNGEPLVERWVSTLRGDTVTLVGEQAFGAGDFFVHMSGEMKRTDENATASTPIDTAFAPQFNGAPAKLRALGGLSGRYTLEGWFARPGQPKSGWSASAGIDLVWGGSVLELKLTGQDGAGTDRLAFEAWGRLTWDEPGRTYRSIWMTDRGELGEYDFRLNADRSLVTTDTRRRADRAAAQTVVVRDDRGRVERTYRDSFTPDGRVERAFEAIWTRVREEKLPLLATEHEWPQYRGPDTLGIARSGGLLRDRSQVGLEVRWKRPLGSGYSGVVIHSGQAITMYSDGDSDVMAAFDEESGAERWRYRVGRRYEGFDGAHDGPLSTPLVTSNRVVGLSPEGRLFAVDAASGTPAWSVDLVTAFGAVKPYNGFGASPILAGDVVVLQVGGEHTAIVGFDTGTGRKLWTTGNDSMRYQTPVVVRHDERSVVVAAGMKHLYGLEPATGEMLWKFEHGGGGSAYGAESLTPVPAGDGRIFLAHKDDGAKLVRLNQRGDSPALETLWENGNIRRSYDVAVYHEDHIYAYSTGFLICVDARTGEARWRSREPGDGSLTLVEGHLVILTRDGTLHVAKASPAGYDEIADIDLFRQTSWAAPSFANGRIYVRSLGEMARVDLTLARAPARLEAPGDAAWEATRFGKFLRGLERTRDDRQASIDAYLESVESFPIVEGNWVHFVYRGPADDVAVAGDLTEVARAQPLSRVEGTDLFHHSVRLESDVRLNYVLLVDYGQTLDPLNPRKTRTTVLTDDMQLSWGDAAMEMSWFAMPYWKPPEFLEPDPATRKGRIEPRELPSAVLESSIPLKIYTPAGYESDDRRYPTIYVHGGDEALEQGDWASALDNLAGNGVQPLIAVIIGYSPPWDPRYIRVVGEEIVPYVDRNFRTVATRSSRANYGGGTAGAWAYLCTFGHRGLFGGLATQSALLNPVHQPLLSSLGSLQEIVPPAGENPLAIYIDWGAYDLRNSHENWDLGQTNAAVAEFLVQRGYPVTGGQAPDGSGWSSWRNRTRAVLEALFPL